MARKILLAEIVGPGVTTITPNPLDPAKTAATLQLSNSNFTATKITTNGWCTSLDTQSISAGAYYFEAIVVASATGTGIGVGKSTMAIATANLGGDALSWGYNGNNGAIGTNGAGSVAGATFAAGDVVGCAVDMTAGKIWFHKNGIWQGAGANPSTAANPNITGLTGPVFPGVSGWQAGVDSITLITDPSKMYYAAPVGFTAGWYTSATVGGSNYYFASEGFITSPTDTPANQYYDPRIAPDGDPIYDRSVTCCLWSSSNAQVQNYSDAPASAVSAATIALGDIDLINPDGGLDTFVQTPMRDGTITLKLGYYGNAYSTFTPVATGVIDDVAQTDEHTARIYLRGKMAKLDKAAQTNVYNAITPNAALESYTLPLAMGTVKWAPFVTLDPANLEYQLGDSYIGPVSEVRDQGALITQGVGWSCSAIAGGSPLGQYGVRRLTNPAGKQCATHDGELTLGAVLVNAQPFGAWSAGDPPGFAHVVNANTTFTNPSGTLARLLCTTGTGAYQATLQPTAACVSGVIYVVEIVVSSWTSGTASVMVQPNSGAVVNATSFCEITKAGTYRFSFLSNGTNRPIGIEWGKVVCDMQISGVKVTAATKIERLPAWLSYLCVTRGGLVSGDLDTAGTITALDTAAPYLLNYYCQDATRIPDILQQTMDSFAGWIFEDRFGVLKVGRLQAPSSTSVLSLTDTELVGDISYYTDKAPGLSAVLAGVKNYSVHGTSDIAGSVFVPGTGDPTTAAQLQLPWLAQRRGIGTLANLYAQTAANNPASPSLLTLALQVQNEANRRVGLYNVQRGFYACKAFLDDTTSYTLNPGDTVTVTTKRLGMTSGKNLLVVGIKSRFLSNVVELILWG